MMRIVITAIIAMLTPVAAVARNDAGTLATLITPNSGVPALTLAGGSVAVIAREQAEVALLLGESRVLLSCEWDEPEGDVNNARCTIPADTAAGMYTIVANGDRNANAVFVYESFPETYAVAHLTDPHIGSTAHARPASAILADTVTHLNSSDAAFVVMTGDLTEHGTAEEFRVFIDTMQECRLPVFVTPGAHDRKGPDGEAFEQFFGPTAHAFRFGEDGYLVFDTSQLIPSDDLGSQAGMVERLRRGMKNARWQVGLTYRFDAAMGMRTQLALFVDAPLDFLLFGHIHRENAVDEIIVPWGRTAALSAPAALDGVLRYIDVKPEQPFPRAAETVATTE